MTEKRETGSWAGEKQKFKKKKKKCPGVYNGRGRRDAGADEWTRDSSGEEHAAH